jgi:iron complex outermembrane receptor protein
MKLGKLLLSLLLTSGIPFSLGTPAQAKDVGENEINKNIPHLNEIPVPVRSAGTLAQTPTPASTQGSVVVITSVKANSTEKGVEVILETTLGEQLQVTNRSTGNNFIADVTAGQLQLPNGDTFIYRSEKPIAGITEIKVINVDANTVRVTVVGEKTLPAVELFDDDAGLTFAVASDVTVTQQPETPQREEKPTSETPPEEPAVPQNDPIELVVTGQQDGYRVPDALTVTKTDTPLRDIPANIQVVPRQVFEDQGVLRLDEALRNVGGVTFNSNFGNRGQDFQVRGFSATQYRNGLREDTGACCSFNNRTAQETADLERIEVLKGSASVLFGQGEPGGIINLISKKPLTTPYYNIGFTAGSFDFYRPTLDFSGPLTADGSLTYRLNAAYESAGSFRDFVDSRRYFIAPTLGWTISPSTKLTLEASYLQDRRTFDRGLIVLNGSDRPAKLPFNRALFDPKFSTTNIEETRAYLFLDHQFARNLSLRSAFRYTTSFESDREGTSNIVGLLDDNRTVEIESYFGDQLFETFTFQNDLAWNFNTGSIAHKLLLGLEVAKNSARYTSQAPPEQEALTGGLLDIFEPNYNAITYTGGYEWNFEGDRIDQRTLGIYLQDQITLANNIKFLVGGRFDRVTSEQRFGDFSEDGEDNAFSPRLGLVYQPSRNISLYASYSRSFVPVAGRSATNRPFKPEQGTQYEVGVKTDLIENRLSATLSAYNITKSNVATTDPDNPDFSIQVGEQRGRGIDLDIVGEVLPGWNIIASYAYLDAEITKDNTFEVGNRLNNIPRNTASLWTTYSIQSGKFKGLGFGAGIFFNDQRIGDLSNSFSIPGYTRFDAAVYYNRDNFRAALNFKNLFDTEYYAAAQNRNSVIPGAPFSILGSISWQF